MALDFTADGYWRDQRRLESNIEHQPSALAMPWISINCPQCSGTLPRQAIWRTVTCGFCGALVTRMESVVMRDAFRQALALARQEPAALSDGVQCGGHRYRLLQPVGAGEISKVYVAMRVGALPLLATLKLSDAPGAAARYAREAQVLRELQSSQGADAAYFTQRLPQVLAQGVVDAGQDNNARHALVLRYPNGYWGSLAAVQGRHAQGLDARHVVWIWRRMLEVLGFIHRQDWCHGDVRPEHALVHPQDHGVLLIGWSSAHAKAGAKDKAGDLLSCARVMRVLLAGAIDGDGIPQGVPSGLAELVLRAGEDHAFCQLHGAAGLDALLKAAATAAYGAPRFVPLTL